MADDTTEWKTIKIPLAAYNQALALREQFAYRGIDALPPEVRNPVIPSECPRCGSGVNHLHISYEQIRCTNQACGYTSHVLGLSADTWKGIGIGAVVSLGLVGLVALLNEPSKKVTRGAKRPVGKKSGRKSTTRRARP